jgi:phosphate transport system ATP-binding protein
MQQAQRISDQTAFFLAEDGEPGHVVEFGSTNQIFNGPIDERTNDYVNGRFG